MVQILSLLALLFCQISFGYGPWQLDALPRANNVYFDGQGCRYLGELHTTRQVDLYRLCPGIEPALVTELPLPSSGLGSTLENAPPGSRLHFFVDEHYPLWIQPPSGQPFPLPLTDHYREDTLLSLARDLKADQQGKYQDILIRWCQQSTGFFGSVLKGVQGAFHTGALTLPFIAYAFSGFLIDGYRINRIKADRGFEHVSSIGEALRIMSSAALGTMSAKGTLIFGLSALIEEIGFRFIAQQAVSAGLGVWVSANDNWPYRQRMISRISRFAGSAIMTASYLYDAPSRGLARLMSMFLDNYLVNSALYENYGLAASTTAHMGYNLLVQTFMEGALCGLLAEMAAIPTGMDAETATKIWNIASTMDNR